MRFQRIGKVYGLATIIVVTMCVNLHAQQTLDSITNTFNAFRNKTFTEKIFLHTDRSSYFTGETLWFTVYHMDATFHKPVDWSKVVYVEILDADKTAVVQGKFMLTENSSTGTFFLPATLNTGHYEIRAYTSWMKNFDETGFFHQTLTIINPFRELEKKVTQNSSYDIQFFPEGGDLVSGLECKVGVRAVGKDGRGITFRGAILNQQHDTITKFSSLKFGLGSFTFSPGKDEQYRAVITDSDNKSFLYPLPAAKADGMAMQLSELDSKIRITVRSTDLAATPVYLFAHTRLSSVLTAEQILKNGEAVFVIDKRALGEGISNLTVFNDQGRPVCERLWFKRPINSSGIKATLTQTEFSTRQKVDLEILMTDGPTKEVSGTMSVVVYKADSLDVRVDNVVEYVWLTSDLRGKVEDPAYYFETESPEIKEATNNLMLTHGWRRFRWDDILSGREKINSAPELGSHLIRGKITNSLTGKPEGRVAAYLTFPEAPVNVYVSSSDSSGRIMFETKNIFGKRSLVLQADERKGNRYQLEIDDPFYKGVSTYPSTEFRLDNTMETTVRQRSLHMQVYTLFYKDTPPVTRVFNNETFYGKPDERYLLDDYTRFPTLEEVMREYVPGVRVLKTKDQFRLSNIDVVNNAYFHDEPLVLIDGVPIFDMNALMKVDPLKIKRLDAITKRYYLQAGSFDGIVSLTSFDHDIAGFQLPNEALVTTYAGMEETREFFSPRYETEQQQASSVPDVRYVLYRSSTVLTPGQLSFFTSDITGEFKIVIQVLSRDGVPGYYSTSFRVK